VPAALQRLRPSAAIGLKSCGFSKTLVGTNSAPADKGTPKLDIDNTVFINKCCVTPPTTCTAIGLVRGLFVCRANSAASFYDLKKGTNTVASTSDDDIRSACCTPTSDAKCSDWTLKSCGFSKTLVGTNSAPADKGAPKLDIDNTVFINKCCVTPQTPQTTCTTIGLVRGVLVCRANSAASFYDLKKGTNTVASTSDADIRSACCTPTSDAKCSDWTLKTCATGTALVGTKSAPADKGDPKLDIDLTVFRSTCCASPLKCSEYSEDTDGAVSYATWPLLAVTVAVTLRVL